MKLKFLLPIISFMMMDSVHADKHSPEGASWFLGYGNPVVSITVINSKVTASVWNNMPSTVLQTVNSLLWQEHRDAYVKIKDFNNDGMMDVGVIKGSGYGGSNICYAVYEYEPIVYSYNEKPSLTSCTP